MTVTHWNYDRTDKNKWNELHKPCNISYDTTNMYA